MTSRSIGNEFKVFKIPLEQLCQSEKRKIPHLVAKCCKYLEHNATDLQVYFIYKICIYDDNNDDDDDYY